MARSVSQDIADALFWWNAALFRGAAFLHPAIEDRRFMLRFLAPEKADVLKEPAETETHSWLAAAPQIDVDGSIVVDMSLPSTTLADWAKYCTSCPQRDVFLVFADGTIQACTLRTNGSMATALQSGVGVKVYVFPGYSAPEPRQEVAAVESVKWKVFVPAVSLKV
jgi:hypothetical protein